MDSVVCAIIAQVRRRRGLARVQADFDFGFERVQDLLQAGESYGLINAFFVAADDLLAYAEAIGEFGLGYSAGDANARD